MTNQTDPQKQCPYPIVEVLGISKQFPGVLANDDISLTIQCGEIHTILGENGAGKSTLMKILSGMLQPSKGKIIIRDEEVTLSSPQVALGHGIGTVYQHFALVPNLSVIENLMLGMGRNLIDIKGAEQKFDDLQKNVGITLSPHQEVRFLSIGMRQRVEILKVLFRGSTILLLDEPTSVLTPLEVRELFSILLRLKAEGVGVIFITHKLDEALEISDKITILSHGRKVGQINSEELATTENDILTERIINMMFDTEDDDDDDTEETFPLEARVNRNLEEAPVVLQLEHVTALNNQDLPAIRGLSLKIRAGEIVGIAGVAGNGQKELAEVIAGQRSVTSGHITLEEEHIENRGTGFVYKAGIAYITDDRLGEGCIPSMSVADNLVLKTMNQHPFSKYSILNPVAINDYAERLISEFNVKTTGSDVEIGKLSGGNIQKLLLARELSTHPKVLICNKPTHGLDVKTAQFVFEILREQAAQGMAILYISSELDEILMLSDRVGVIYDGQILDTFPRDEADKETIGRLMLGVQA